MLTVGSLFTGIGGIDLGLERTGHFKTIWMSEIDSYANRVLAKHWPDVPNLGNVKEIDFEQVPRPDVIVGGYPCQPFSTAGKRQGENDPRHLWPECLRALRVLRPRYALFENVRGHISLGFPQVLADLASIGFNAEWQVIPAAAVGAPHKRDRLFIVAYPNGGNTPNGRKCSDVSGEGSIGRDDRGGSGSDIGQECLGSAREIARDVAYPDCEQQHGRGHRNGAGTLGEWAAVQKPIGGSRGDVADADLWQISGGNRGDAADRSEIPSGGDYVRGTASYAGWEWWEVEPDVGRVANGVPARVDRLRALGNAVVPQVAELIGYMIAEHANNA